jgi:hypothetical protein
MRSRPLTNYNGVKLPSLKDPPQTIYNENENENPNLFKLEPREPSIDPARAPFTRRGHNYYKPTGGRRRRNPRKTRKQRRRKSRRN